MTWSSIAVVLGLSACGHSGKMVVDTPIKPYQAPDISEITGIDEDDATDQDKTEAPAPAPAPAPVPAAAPASEKKAAPEKKPPEKKPPEKKPPAPAVDKK
ncbi:MAG: hypothetical protein ACM31C_15975 [Acidobacteriota bacterium]